MNSDHFDEQGFELQFQKALRLRESGSLHEAIDQLRTILTGHQKNDTAVLGVMGNIFWDLNDLDAALDCYQNAVQLSPDSEMASLGFFHTLWKRGERDAGFDEIERFLKISDSTAYGQLLDEMGEELIKVK